MYFYVKADSLKSLDELSEKRQKEIQEKLENKEFLPPKLDEQPKMEEMSPIDEELLDDGITKSAKLILDAHLNIEKALVELKKAFIEQENPEVAKEQIEDVLEKISKLSSVVKKISDLLFEYKSK